MGPVNSQNPSPDVRLYELVTLPGEPVYIRFERTHATSDYAPSAVEITVQYGYFGDASKEQAIADSLRANLATLAQVD